LLVSLKLDAKLIVEDSQVAIPPARDRFRRNGLHFLCYHTNIGALAAVITEAIKAEAVSEMAEQNDIMLDRDIRSPSAAATTAATATTAAAASEAATTAASEAATATTSQAATAAAEACATSRALGEGRSARTDVTEGIAAAWSRTGRPLPCTRPSA
jgi:hypothetical protein